MLEEDATMSPYASAAKSFGLGCLILWAALLSTLDAQLEAPASPPTGADPAAEQSPQRSEAPLADLGENRSKAQEMLRKPRTSLATPTIRCHDSRELFRGLRVSKQCESK